MKRYGPAIATLALLTGCAPQAPSKSDAAAPELQAVSTIELMGHVIAPAAQGVWDRQGTEVTAEGERELYPADDAGWLEAENASATVAETAKLLLTPERLRDGQVWVVQAQALNKAGHDAFKAAEARDKQAFFAAGGRIYDACTACHEQYIQVPGAAPVALPKS